MNRELIPWWALLIEVWIVWLLWCVGAINGKALFNARNRVPLEKQGGVSLLPLIPVFPMGFWAFAICADVFVQPWASVSIAAFHAVLGLIFIFCIVRDRLRLRALNR